MSRPKQSDQNIHTRQLKACIPPKIFDWELLL